MRLPLIFVCFFVFFLTRHAGLFYINAHPYMAVNEEEAKGDEDSSSSFFLWLPS